MELCGFGVIAAASRSAALLQSLRPSRVLLLGIAGTYDVDSLPVSSARRFASVGLWGLGAGAGEAHTGPEQMLPQWTDDATGESIEQELPTHGGLGRLITVCAASASTAEAQPIRQRYPDALAEDMEAFAVALSCRLAGVPFDCIRGISNPVGDRDLSRWQIRSALEAAWDLAQTEWVSTP
jgi:futalosine hydrolase